MTYEARLYSVNDGTRPALTGPPLNARTNPRRFYYAARNRRPIRTCASRAHGAVAARSAAS